MQFHDNKHVTPPQKTSDTAKKAIKLIRYNTSRTCYSGTLHPTPYEKLQQSWISEIQPDIAP